ncbi:hypothetical protein LDL59_05360 [Kaistella anthropi]|nr:hypothetical protein [Kaistella anthropi]
MSQDQVFKFEYNDYNSLPPRLSYQQDFYGYANSNSIQSLLNINDFDNNSNIKELMKKHFSYIDMANRNVSSLSLKGNLNKIIYPAGGYSVIDYENNTTEEDKPVENWKSHTFSVINSNCDSPNGPASFKEIEFESNGSQSLLKTVLTL